MKDEMLMFKKNALLGNISAEPLCQAYKQAWRMCGDDKEMLVGLALKQQSIPYLSHACYKELGLTKEYIKENFKDYINGRVLKDCDGVDGYTYALYVGHDQDFDITADVTSLMWCDSPQVVIAQTKCPTIYISNKSKVHLICDGFNTVNVKLFDESILTIKELDENSNIVVFKYSEDAQVEQGRFCFGKTKVFNKKLKL